jgi:hypothetical protein
METAYLLQKLFGCFLVEGFDVLALTRNASLGGERLT